MKKILLLTVAVILALAVAVISLGAGIYSKRDDLSFKEISHYGDYSRLEGIEVEANACLDDRLLWNSVTRMGEFSETEGSYEFHLRRQREKWPKRYYGIGTNPDFIFQVSRTDSDSQLKNYFPKEAEALNKMWNEVKPGEEKTFIVKLSDVMDFYPFGNISDLPELFSLEHALFLMENGSLAGNEYEVDVMLSLAEQFKIPVLKTEKLEYSLEKDEAGSYSGIGIASLNEGEEYFPLSTFTGIDDENIYFIFDAHTSEGNLVDLSYLSHGYGIYKMPYKLRSESPEKYGPEPQKIERILERDPNQKQLDLTVDDENILLAYIDNGKTYIDIIDKNSLETKDTIEVNEDVRYLDMEVEEGFVILDISLNSGDSENVYHMEDRRLGVLERKADSYFLNFICPSHIPEIDDYYTWTEENPAYDGERLIFAGSFRRDREKPSGGMTTTHDAPDLMIKIYTEDGPVFAGKYESSLMTGFTNKNEYQYAVRSFYPDFKVTVK